MYYSGRLAFTLLWSHLVPILISQVHNAELPPPMHYPGSGAIFIHPMYVPLPFRKTKIGQRHSSSNSLEIHLTWSSHEPFVSPGLDPM